MKKFLLTLAAAAMTFAASAASVEFDLSNPESFGVTRAGANARVFPESFSLDGVTVTVNNPESVDEAARISFFTNQAGTSVDFRCGKSNKPEEGKEASTFTITAPENITKIEFTGTVRFVELTENTWTGDAVSMTFTANGQFKLTKMVVTYGEAGTVEPEVPVVEPAGEGTLESPYNVAKAIELATAIGDTGNNIEDVYVKGIVTEIKEISVNYGNATYYISDVEGGEKFYIYRGKGLNGENFTSEDELVVGAVVVLNGALANYKGTSPQMNTGSKIVSYSAGAEGTLNNPYTASKALELATAIGDTGNNITGVYVKGFITEIKEISTSYGNATYYIGDAVDSETPLQVYRGKWYNGEAFSSEDQLEVGAEVVIYGDLANYKGTSPQVNTNSQVYSYNGVTADDLVEPEAVTVNNIAETIALETGAKINVNYQLTVGFVNNNNVFACDAAGDFIQLYGTNTLAIGDVIPAAWEGTYKLFNGVTPEIEHSGVPAATAGTFTPAVVAAADVTTALVNHVITIEDVVLAEASPADKVNFTGTVGDVTLNLRNNYTLASVPAGTYDITVVVTIYNGEPSLYVTNYASSGDAKSISFDANAHSN